MSKTLHAYDLAKEILNRDYAYWGEIITVNTELILDMAVVEMGLAGRHEQGTEKRKCLAVTMLPTYEHADATMGRISNFFSGVPTETFHTIPQAMYWIDDYMNFYASRELIRDVSDKN